MAEHFPSQDDYDALEEEVMDYFLTPTSSLPSVNREEGKPTHGEDLCTYWQKMGTLKTINGNLILLTLPSASLLYLTQMPILKEFSALYEK